MNNGTYFGGLLCVPLAAAAFDVEFSYPIHGGQPVCAAFEAALAGRRKIVPKFTLFKAAASGTQARYKTRQPAVRPLMIWTRKTGG